MLIHNFNHLANKTVYWNLSDSEETYNKNLVTQKKLLEINGHVDSKIAYCFNSDGFRTAEFDQHVDIICFGCSFTMGTGLKYEYSWPAQLEQITKLRTANLGHAGSSNDTVFRFADYYLEKLKPRYAVWFQTDSSRFEIVDPDAGNSINILANQSHALENDIYSKIWFGSEFNHEINLRKNTLAFEKLCDSLQIKSIILPRSTYNLFDSTDLARDLMHPGPKFQQTVAQKVAELISVQF